MALEKSGLQLVAEGAAAYIDDMGRAHDASGRFVAGISSAGGQVNAASEMMIGGLRRVGEIAVDALGQAAQAAGQFVADSIGVAGDFEASVNNLAAISGDALAQAGFSFDDVSAKALQLGQDTAYSAAESIAAMTELVKGGVPVTDVMTTATDATLALAAAGGVDLTNAAEIVAKQLGVWGDLGLTATEATDLMTQAANASVVGVEDLAQGLAQAGGTAKTAGVEYKDLVQTMGLIAPAFSSAADAGTSLKTFLSRLVPSTTPAKDAMYDLGLWTRETGSAFYDASGSFVGMEEAARLLQSATADLSEEQRLAAFNTIFGSDAIRAASEIAAAGAEGFNQFGADMEAVGTAAGVAAIQNQGFNFAMDSLKGSIETLQIVIGSALLPILTELINTYLIPGVNVVMQFAQALFGNVDAFGQLSPQLQTVVTGIQGFLVAAQPVADFIGANLTPILGALAGVAGGVLVAALVAAAAPFAPLLGVIAAAGAAAAALYGAWENDFGGIRQATEQAMAAIQSVIQSVMGVVLTFWQQNGAQITAFAQQTWTQIQQIVGTITAIVATIITKVFGAIASFIDKHGDEIQSILSFAWNSIQSTISLVLNTIQGIVNTVLGIVTGDWEKASGGIQQIVDGLSKYLNDQFNNIVKLVQGIGPSLLSAAQSVGKSIVDGIVGGVKSGIGSVIDAAKGMAQAAIDAAMGKLKSKSPSKAFTDVGLTAPQGLALGFEQGMPAVESAAMHMAASSVSAAQQVVSSPASYSTSSATSYGGDTYNISVSGSLSKADVEAAFVSALSARTSRASRLSRIGGGAG